MDGFKDAVVVALVRFAVDEMRLKKRAQMKNHKKKPLKKKLQKKNLLMILQKMESKLQLFPMLFKI